MINQDRNQMIRPPLVALVLGYRQANHLSSAVHRSQAPPRADSSHVVTSNESSADSLR